jgi:hypothetical protein
MLRDELFFSGETLNLGLQLRGGAVMRTKCKLAVVSAALLMAAGAANAGCGKGAIAGGVIGHVAGKHGVAGAAIGCVVGHHAEKKKQKQAAAATAAAAPNNTAPAKEVSNQKK